MIHTPKDFSTHNQGQRKVPSNGAPLNLFNAWINDSLTARSPFFRIHPEPGARHANIEASSLQDLDLKSRDVPIL